MLIDAVNRFVREVETRAEACRIRASKTPEGSHDHGYAVGYQDACIMAVSYVNEIIKAHQEELKRWTKLSASLSIATNPPPETTS
jgi:hypothetical protein